MRARELSKGFSLALHTETERQTCNMNFKAMPENIINMHLHEQEFLFPSGWFYVH